MSITEREFWTVFHGMIVGAIYLLAFAGGLAGLWSFRGPILTSKGVADRVRRLIAGTWIMAAICWATVITGTYVVYPWYRAKLPDSPRSKLLADAAKSAWHTFGMEWKEHVAWLSPILATAAALLITVYRAELTGRPDIRRSALALFTAAFAAAAVAGVFGAFLNKVAPIL